MPGTRGQLIPIDDVRDPRLADYANLKDRQLAALAAGLAGGMDQGLFMAEGELVIRQMIRSGIRARSILITPTRLETMRDALSALPPDTPIYLISQELMNQSVGFHIHRGILAAGIRPPPRTPADVIGASSTLVILEDLANHDNLGGIFRAAAALGGIGRVGILLSPRCCDPLYRKAIRVSMGAALRIPFATIDPWPDGLAEVRGAGFTLIAMTPAAKANLNAFSPPSRPALLLGAEGPGLTSGALAACEVHTQIPMDPEMDSLNVVVAAGIALHRLVRI